MRIAASVSCAFFIICSPAGRALAQSGSAPPVEKVTGIGGFFFRAADPRALAEWYERHLGVNRTPASYTQEPWRQDAGPSVFAPFPKDTKYFGADDRQWMINFRVRDLDAMVAQLRRAGVEVEVDPQAYPNGRFARLKDPEGNPIQLWEPRRPGQTR
jgi:predicted enzyme related to lactoylglutathione lyase